MNVRRLLAAVLLLLGSFQPTQATDLDFTLRPRVARPGAAITLELKKPAVAGQKLFLRLAGDAMTRDTPLGADQLQRGLAPVVLPELRQGAYKASLVGEAGELVLSGPLLRVLASEAPVISRIEPRVSYPSDDAYSFEILGSNFADEADDNEVRINRVPIAFAAYPDRREARRGVEACDRKFPCLVASPRALRVFGVPAELLGPAWPKSVSVKVDALYSAEERVLLSPVKRSTPALLALLGLCLLVGAVWIVTREKARAYRPGGKTYHPLVYLFIDQETNTYSLSRFQLLLWTAGAVFAYTYLAASQSLVQWIWGLPPVPDGLPTLLGVSAGTTAVAASVTEARGTKGAGPKHPGLGDFLTTGGVFAPERLQFFIWTAIGVFGFVSATLAQDPATVTELPKIPESFLPLMGVSSLGYLAGKVVRKPGPVIKDFQPKPLPSAAGTVRILGENFSPRAEVWLNGHPIPTGQITAGPAQAPDSDFVAELTVSLPAALEAAAPGVAAVKVVNKDGQSAEH